MKAAALFNFKREYFLFLLPVFFVLHGFTEYFPAVSEQDALWLLIKYLIATISLTILLRLVLKSWQKAAVFCFLLMAFNFFFGALHDLSKRILAHSFIVKYSFLLPFILVLFILLFIFFKTTNKRFSRLANYLNILFIILIAIDIYTLSVKLISKKEVNQIANIQCHECAKPDIYLIIADEYAGTEELKELFHFDNSPFEDSLRNRGFRVLRQTKSNYNYTPFSIASMLNMDFLPPIKSGKITNAEINRCTNYINNATVIKTFKNLGYTLKNNSIFDLDNIPTQIETRFLRKKIRLISDQTFLNRLNNDIRFNLITKYKWRSEMSRVANEQLNDLNFIYNNALKEARNISSTPRFVYTHLMMPHYPYFYNKNGKLNDVALLMEGEQTRQKEYLEYLQWSNQKFLYLIDQIKHNSKNPPIVIFMSDHGFREFTNPVDERYHFMNIAAVYTPVNLPNLYDGMSNVNLFKIVFNNQFQQQLPLIKDSTVFLHE